MGGDWMTLARWLRTGVVSLREGYRQWGRGFKLLAKLAGSRRVETTINGQETGLLQWRGEASDGQNVCGLISFRTLKETRFTTRLELALGGF